MKVASVQMKDRPQRSWLERMATRAPDAFRNALRPVFWLSPRSRVRAAVVRRVVDLAYAATNRQDLDAVKVYFLPDAAINFPDDVGIDYDDRYEGRDVVIAQYRRWLDEWGTVRREPVGLVDRGEVIVVLAHETVRGESSGLEVTRELGAVFRLRDGGIAEQWEFFSWDEALAP